MSALSNSHGVIENVRGLLDPQSALQLSVSDTRMVTVATEEERWLVEVGTIAAVDSTHIDECSMHLVPEEGHSRAEAV